jgi:hypothetical protein
VVKVLEEEALLELADREAEVLVFQMKQVQQETHQAHLLVKEIMVVMVLIQMVEVVVVLEKLGTQMVMEQVEMEQHLQ